MSVLSHLEPQRVFAFFEQICAIPHGSGNTKAISDFVMDFARARCLEAHQDEWNNVIVIKGPSAGYEAAEPVIFQGHLDMVCEKTAQCPKDMAAEGLDLMVEGDTVYAKDTTLGGDDGIAVAMALALLDDDALPHPRLEVVLTTEEETGMDGAVNIDLTPLRGRRMLNLDSEAEGVLTVGCAGGNRTVCRIPVKREDCPWGRVTVTVGGLAGGHSGAEIHRGLGNACVLLGRVLAAAEQASQIRIVSVSGGGKDNAIPREASATLAAEDVPAVLAAAAKLGGVFQAEYRVTDSGVFVSAAPAAAEGTPMDGVPAARIPMDGPSTARVVSFLACAPNGVQTMSADIAGLVQTSLNLGILETEADSVTASFCLRSSVESEKEMMVRRLEHLSALCGGTARVWGDYPAWAYRPQSPLRDLVTQVYREQYGSEPRIEAIHAGLECGLFAGKLPDLDCVSLGPDLTEIHTTRERMHIASVGRVWNMVTEVLRRMK